MSTVKAKKEMPLEDQNCHFPGSRRLVLTNPKKQCGLKSQLKIEEKSKIVSSGCICFNPNCSLPYSRIFPENHPHAGVSACENWKIRVTELGKLIDNNSGNEHERNSQYIQLMMGKRSFQQSLATLTLIQNVDWSVYLQTLKQSLLNKAQKQITTMLAAIRTKIDELRSEKLLQNMRQLHQEIVSRRKSEIEVLRFTDYVIAQYLGGLGKKQIKIRSIKSKDFQFPSFLSCLEDFQQKLFSHKQVAQQSQHTVRHEQFKSFILDQVSPFNKLQQIASMCGKKCHQFALKQRNVGLQCPLCTHCARMKISNQQFDQQLKAVKKQISLEMLNHCFDTHYQLIFEKYDMRIQKNTPHPTISHSSSQLSFEQLISEIKQRNCTKMLIIDRETGIAGSCSPKLEPGTYKFEIVSKNNKHMAKAKHLVTPDRKCTEFMINYILLYVCEVENLIELENAIVESNSKDVNKVEGLKQVLFGSHPTQTKNQQAASAQVKKQNSQNKNSSSQLIDQQSVDWMDNSDCDEFGGQNLKVQNGLMDLNSERILGEEQMRCKNEGEKEELHPKRNMVKMEEKRKSGN